MKKDGASPKFHLPCLHPNTELGTRKGIPGVTPVTSLSSAFPAPHGPVASRFVHGVIAEDEPIRRFGRLRPQAQAKMPNPHGTEASRMHMSPYLITVYTAILKQMSMYIHRYMYTYVYIQGRITDNESALDLVDPVSCGVCCLASSEWMGSF